jgi:hypothetical protein
VVWIKRSDNSLLVAAEGGNILAVGSVTDAGQITLNCVSPGARFRGVAGRCSARSKPALWSVATHDAPSRAQRLLGASGANGYVEEGPPVGNFRTSSGYPMFKLPTSRNS